ncbi:unnamed protein product, partial [Mesorhabditis spiculigera]
MLLRVLVLLLLAAVAFIACADGVTSEPPTTVAAKECDGRVEARIVVGRHEFCVPWKKVIAGDLPIYWTLAACGVPMMADCGPKPICVPETKVKVYGEGPEMGLCTLFGECESKPNTYPCRKNGSREVTCTKFTRIKEIGPEDACVLGPAANEDAGVSDEGERMGIIFFIILAVIALIITVLAAGLLVFCFMKKQKTKGTTQSSKSTKSSKKEDKKDTKKDDKKDDKKDNKGGKTEKSVKQNKSEYV